MISIKTLKDTIQSCHLNFLIGSGLSCPFLSVLGPIEVLLTELESKQLSADEKKVARASLYKKYFDGAITKNPEIISDIEDAVDVLESYRVFLRTLNSILQKRKSAILGKEVNVFTTNLDVFLEKGLEDSGLEFNDGFNGRFRPVFNTGNFRKSRLKRSLHYDNKSEVSVFNLVKLHGSLTWQMGVGEEIIFSHDLAQVKKIQWLTVTPGILVDIPDNMTSDELVAAVSDKVPDATIEEFMTEYEKLPIINPTKEKFRDTVLNQNYYELLRIYSNELEKENSLLFVMGFSFADEHIRKMTLRAADSNPTLRILIFAHTSESAHRIERSLGGLGSNGNIEIISPPVKRVTEEGAPVDKDEFEYTLHNITEKQFLNVLKEDQPTSEQPPTVIE